MSIIELRHVNRTFKITKREKNFLKFILHREFEIKEAVHDINISIEEGELVGFIGPNGAGKSTTIKIMSGILVPSNGNVQVLGIVPYNNRKCLARQIGVVFGQRSQLWWDLPVIDTFLLIKRLYKIEDSVYEKNVQEYSKLLGVDEFMNQPVRQLSLGQRMRADLCAALLHNPKILFLDEPTIGLDVVVKKQIREMIKKINQTRRVTVILTTHDMKDVEEVCERIILINKGKIVLDGPLEQFKKEFQGMSEIVAIVDKNIQQLEVPGIEDICIEGCNIKIKFNARKITSAEIINCLMRQCTLVHMQIHEPEIDDIIRNLYSIENACKNRE